MWKVNLKELLDDTDVQDPTDFPPSSTVPGLRDLDGALRCNICQELYEAPVVLTCGHCFCSLCARNQLGEKPACPTCWRETTISSIRVNPTMEEAVTAWKDARRFVLHMINDTLNGQTKAIEASRPTKRRKPNARPSGVVPDMVSHQRRSGRSDVGSSDDDAEREMAMSSGTPALGSNSSIECPVCAKSVPMTMINDHLDSNCKYHSALSSGKIASSSKSGQKDAWSKLLNGTRSGKDKEKHEAEVDNPLPKASYTVLKDKQIRDLLAAYNLSTTGDRPQLIARHERWVALYNANLDRSPILRKRPAELQLEMRRWEEDRRGARKDPLKIDITEYRRANKAEFDKLIQRARVNPVHGSPKQPNSPKTLVVESAVGSESGPGPASDRWKRLKVAGGGGGETDAIVVDSDPEG
ncbi:hypothetical protein B0F90DRAFT_1711692 [Multifurca ochricompacta]|uniref:Postreplication repair E3 ubiquitin-protein ligase RAD18 n=1 Tax=Multifurca ochricompacta TaxID=376703 RepID=A0AAD4M6F8_9AGAM|nr:hypothetical protein B0F90DRAFT_1711692 [Multifurca ochricompacta]